MKQGRPAVSILAEDPHGWTEYIRIISNHSVSLLREENYSTSALVLWATSPLVSQKSAIFEF